MSVVEARFAGGPIEVTTEPLSHAPDVQAVRVDFPGCRVDLFAQEAEQLARALTEAVADITAPRVLRRHHDRAERLMEIDG